MQEHADHRLTTSRPILVTGSHRSGTTWVGRLLSRSPFVAYIHEPFSVTDAPGPGICNVRFRHWFTYVTGANEARYYGPLRRMVELKYDLLGALASVRSRKALKSVWAEYKQFATYRQKGYVPLIKDPIAFFSAPWLAERFAMHTVVLIRHPAAFVSSVKKLNWRHPFDHFLEQDLLMNEVLYPFEAQVRAFARKEQEIVDQAILLWRMIHHTAHHYRQMHDDWIFVRHEDLSRHPLQGFRELCEQLNLPFTPAVEQAIQDYTGARNPHDPDAPVGSEHTLRRNSEENIYNWRRRLTRGEIDKIRSEVDDVSRFFYADTDW